MKKIYRKGAIGAMIDEYERAVAELKNVLAQISADEFVKIRDLQTDDEDCRSIETIFNHVIRSGNSYANSVRRKFGVQTAQPPKQKFEFGETGESLDALIRYTAETFENRWEMSGTEIMRTIIESNEDYTENLEQLLEHAIVHILRHRRQIEKFLANGNSN